MLNETAGSGERESLTRVEPLRLILRRPFSKAFLLTSAAPNLPSEKKSPYQKAEYVALSVSRLFVS